jgi:hypothetical protein
MARDENAVVYAAEQVCGLYGVQVTREQSIRINVPMPGDARGWRPIFVGQWKDNFGTVHRSGRADLLARPRILISMGVGPVHECYQSVPLWIECKSGEGRMSADQIEFKNYVESNGDAFLLLHDDVRPLLAWFDEHGVEKRCTAGEMKAVVEPIDATELVRLPCKWCHLPRKEHLGAAFGCPGKSRKCWSPDLKARVG